MLRTCSLVPTIAAPAATAGGVSGKSFRLGRFLLLPSSATASPRPWFIILLIFVIAIVILGNSPSSSAVQIISVNRFFESVLLWVVLKLKLYLVVVCCQVVTVVLLGVGSVVVAEVAAPRTPASAPDESITAGAHTLQKSIGELAATVR